MYLEVTSYMSQVDDDLFYSIYDKWCSDVNLRLLRKIDDLMLNDKYKQLQQITVRISSTFKL